MKDSRLIKRDVTVSDSNWHNTDALRIKGIEIHFLKAMKKVALYIVHVKYTHYFKSIGTYCMQTVDNFSVNNACDF